MTRKAHHGAVSLVSISTSISAFRLHLRSRVRERGMGVGVAIGRFGSEALESGVARRCLGGRDEEGLETFADADVEQEASVEMLLLSSLLPDVPREGLEPLFADMLRTVKYEMVPLLG